MLCKVLQVCVLVQIAYLIVAQAQVNVTELTSSVAALNRSFTCQNEAVIYQCVANSTTMDNIIEFETTWRWNGHFVHTFISTQQIGVNSTCNSVRNFLHSTLVYAVPNACVSLLIILTSLPNYEDIKALIECQASAVTGGTEPQNKTIYHNIISDTPKWTNSTEATEDINLSCDSYSIVNDTSTRFLLNISWPGINNTNAMDFDCYALSLWIVGENNTTIYRFTGKTNATYYENIIDLTEATSDLRVQIEISAVNRCNNKNTLQVNRSLSKENNCKNYILNGSNPIPTPESDSGSETSNKYAIILSLIIISIVGLLIQVPSSVW